MSEVSKRGLTTEIQCFLDLFGNFGECCYIKSTQIIDEEQMEIHCMALCHFMEWDSETCYQFHIHVHKQF